MNNALIDAFRQEGDVVTAAGKTYVPFAKSALHHGVRRLYVPTLDLPDDLLDALIDHALTYNASLLVRCSQTLTEAGRIDGRFGKSPVMLLHSFGLLPLSTVVSGVYLDKDDLSLMAQENVALTVLPTFDAGNGFGVAPVSAALERGVRLRLGTADGSFNRTHDVLKEAAALRLLAAAQMNRRDAADAVALAKMCLGENASADRIGQTAEEIAAL